jgi:hypothetical protein
MVDLKYNITQKERYMNSSQREDKTPLFDPAQPVNNNIEKVWQLREAVTAVVSPSIPSGIFKLIFLMEQDTVPYFNIDPLIFPLDIKPSIFWVCQVIQHGFQKIGVNASFSVFDNRLGERSRQKFWQISNPQITIYEYEQEEKRNAEYDTVRLCVNYLIAIYHYAKDHQQLSYETQFLIGCLIAENNTLPNSLGFGSKEVSTIKEILKDFNQLAVTHPTEFIQLLSTCPLKRIHYTLNTQLESGTAGKIRLELAELLEAPLLTHLPIPDIAHIALESAGNSSLSRNAAHLLIFCNVLETELDNYKDDLSFYEKMDSDDLRFMILTSQEMVLNDNHTVVEYLHQLETLREFSKKNSSSSSSNQFFQHPQSFLDKIYEAANKKLPLEARLSRVFRK